MKLTGTDTFTPDLKTTVRNLNAGSYIPGKLAALMRKQCFGGTAIQLPYR